MASNRSRSDTKIGEGSTKVKLALETLKVHATPAASTTGDKHENRDEVPGTESTERE